MKNVIITSIDSHYGDFIINHWLKSLKENVNLHNIDIVILDFGLTQTQRKQVEREDIILVSCGKSGHIVTTRFIETSSFLEKNNYDQVLFIDGGDIIFQSDISSLFNYDKDFFRAVKLDLEVLFYEAFIPFNFKKEKGKEMHSFLIDKPILNAGFILGPSNKFIQVCKKMSDLIINKKSYGPDQVALNYILHKTGVKLIDRKYNFMITTAKEGFDIKDGIFYLKTGEKIAVVHNAGHNRFLRPIGNFGYGKNFNQLHFYTYHLRRLFFRFIGFIKKIHS